MKMLINNCLYLHEIKHAIVYDWFYKNGKNHTYYTDVEH